MGKGSSPRPFKVTNEEYSNRWDAIFGRDNAKKNDTQAMDATQSDKPCDSGSSDNPEGQTGQTETS